MKGKPLLATLALRGAVLGIASVLSVLALAAIVWGIRARAGRR